MDWMKMLLSNPMLIFFGIVVGIPVIVGGVTQIAKMLMRHRERMAMIERGMHPDLPESRSENDSERT